MRAGATVLERELEERDDELFALSELVGEVAASGDGRALVVVGEAGIGKTALLAALRRIAASAGFTVAAAAGGELESDLPLGLVRSLLSPLVVDRATRAVADQAARALGLGGGPPDRDADIGALLDALYWLCVDLAETGPLLLVVDDVQWSDPPSDRFLAYLVRRLEGLPLLLAFGRRTGGPAPAADAAAREPTSTVLRLAALTAPATAALVRRKAPDASDEICAAIHDASGGNPFFALALAEGASEAPTATDLPPGAASRSVLWRLGRLGEHVAAVARALAVLGAGAQLRQLEGLSGLGADETATALDTLLEHGFVADEPWRFAHPVIQSAVLGEISPAALAQLQARAARMLHDDEGEPALVASHLLAADPGQGAWARDVLVDAGAEALATGGFEFAHRCAGHVLAGPSGDRRTEALALRARAACALGLPEAESAVVEAMAAADPQARADLALTLAFHLLATGRGRRAIPLLDDAHDALPAGEVEVRQRLAATAAHVAAMIGDHSEQHRRVAQLGATALAGATPVERMVLAERAYAGFCGTMTASELADTARRVLRGPADPIGSGTAAWALVIAGELDEGIAAFDALLDSRGAAVSEASAAALIANRAVAGVLRGRAADAEADARLAARLSNRSEVPWIREWAHAVLSAVLLLRGDLSEATRVLEDQPERPIEDLSSAIAANQRARLAAVSGRLEDAAARLRELGAFMDAHGIVNPTWWPWRSDLARVLAALGQHDEARDIAHAELALAYEVGGRGAAGPSLVALGLAEEGERGVARLREAVAELAGSEFTTAHVDALIALGTKLRHARLATEAREPLRTALDLAERSGLGGFAALAELELRATGARPRRRALTGAAALTAGEQRVARLAAEGRTNREIAQTLFITPKTVERHLSQAYRKLSIGGRADLKAALAEPTDQTQP